MKKFLTKILLILLPIILCAYPIDYLISNFLSQSKFYAYGESIVWNDIYHGKINSDIVIYGSSRAWCQFSPKIIQDSMQVNTYNLGVDGHNFGLQYFRHLELLKYNETPKLIIMSVDIYTLDKRDDLYNYGQFLPYLLWNSNMKKVTSTYTGFSNEDYYIPLVRYFGEKRALMAAFLSLFNFRQSDPARIKGYKGHDWIWNSDLKNAKSISDGYTANIDSLSVKLFEQFINECIKKKIDIMLVYAPEYIEGQLFVKNRKEILALFKYFSNKYNLDFIDYSKDEICFQKKLFYNSGHLNKKGSEMFTKNLIKSIKSRVGIEEL